MNHAAQPKQSVQPTLPEPAEPEQESEERFRATFEQVAVGIAHVGLEGHWLRVNQKLCEILGYTHDELLQLTFQDITYPEDLQVDSELVRQLLAGEIQTYTLEKRYLRKDGTIIWINLTVSLLRAPPPEAPALGEPKYMIAVIEDINDRKYAELALQERARELSQLNAILSRTTALLEERNRELDQFAHIASHDLKAPLRAIANLSEWIEEDLHGHLPPQNQYLMQLLRLRVRRMEALIDGLLRYSRVGRSETAIETVSVYSLLSEVLDSLAPPPTFTITIQPQMPTLTTRVLLLKQVFSNLVSNATYHHHRLDGIVSISVQEQEQFYKFTVADDGPGIASENHNKIFGIFQTLTARDLKESTGIGLSVVKKIVEVEGGKVGLDSALGQGARFHFLWPKQLKPIAGDR